MRAAIGLVAALCCNTAFGASETPLLDYARELPFISVVEDQSREIERARHEIEKSEPPQEGCANTLGARRFAYLYESLGELQASIGDHSSALDSMTKSLACNPRDPHVHASMATQLMQMGRFDEARAAAARARAIDADEELAGIVLMQMAFIEERWPEAIWTLRNLIDWSRSSRRATHWEIFLWIAQRRSGIATPQPYAPELIEDWPRPALEMLRGLSTEEEVLDVVDDEANDIKLRHKLAEALYYVGEARLANADADTARLYFNATVSLKVMPFIEHRLALAELAKVREQDP
jgi:lipoprotein NlpI